jgi:hypothetical protein
MSKFNAHRTWPQPNWALGKTCRPRRICAISRCIRASPLQCLVAHTLACSDAAAILGTGSYGRRLNWSSQLPGPHSPSTSTQASPKTSGASSEQLAYASASTSACMPFSSRPWHWSRRFTQLRLAHSITGGKASRCHGSKVRRVRYQQPAQPNWALQGTPIRRIASATPSARP